jgi:hypothetical protein
MSAIEGEVLPSINAEPQRADFRSDREWSEARTRWMHGIAKAQAARLVNPTERAAIVDEVV